MATWAADAGTYSLAAGTALAEAERDQHGPRHPPENKLQCSGTRHGCRESSANIIEKFSHLFFSLVGREALSGQRHNLIGSFGDVSQDHAILADEKRDGRGKYSVLPR